MGRRLLIVDDEMDIRLVLGEILRAQGFEVDTAENGEDALRKLKQGRYDLMVLDVLMPVLDGYEVLDRLDDDLKQQMPVIMLTAKAADDDVLKGYSKGACYYLVKPFDNVTLINAILYMLGDIPEEDMLASEVKL